MMRFTCAALLGLAVACGGGGKGSTDDKSLPPPGDGNTGDTATKPPPADAGAEGPLDFETVELGTAQDYIPLLKVGAVELGCTLVAEEPDPPAVAYQCDEGVLFAAQVGTTLRYTCEHITKQQCNELLERVNKKVLEAAGDKQ